METKEKRAKFLGAPTIHTLKGTFFLDFSSFILSKASAMNKKLITNIAKYIDHTLLKPTAT